MAEVEVTFNEAAWNDLVTDVVDKVCVPLMEKVAAACNEADDLKGGGTEVITVTDPDTGETKTHTRSKDPRPGYVADVDGTKTLQKHDYRATCITATNSAMEANARNNTLVNNLYQGEA